MENMPGTLSPEEMARLQMFAEALRTPGIQQGAMSFNPAQGGGMQMPQNGALNGMNAGMQMGKPLAGMFSGKAPQNYQDAVATPVAPPAQVLDVTPAGY